jgi:RHS repeat-associated protein
MTMPGRKYQSGNGSYRYGFNGKENDNDVKGTANQQDYGMRIYDPRVGRFLSSDPLTQKYPQLTAYQFASNNPIAGVDMDGLEFISSFKAYQSQKFYFENLKFSTARHTSNSAVSNPPLPVIAPAHSEANVHIQQLKAMASALRPVSTEDQKKIELAAILKKTIQNQASFSEAKPQGAANEFEAGAVQGVHMTAIAVGAEACPTCFVAYGASQIYNGTKEGDGLKVLSGILFVTPELRFLKGSGPVSGVLEISSDYKSVNAFKNFAPVNPIEFVYSPENNKFLVGQPNQVLPGLSGHQQLVKIGGLNPQTTVGGMFSRGASKEIITNEISGHYFQNWTPAVRKAFAEFLENNTGQTVKHTP